MLDAIPGQIKLTRFNSWRKKHVSIKTFSQLNRADSLMINQTGISEADNLMWPHENTTTDRIIMNSDMGLDIQVSKHLLLKPDSELQSCLMTV